VSIWLPGPQPQSATRQYHLGVRQLWLYSFRAHWWQCISLMGQVCDSCDCTVSGPPGGNATA
jgi:hypothetical protein